MIKTVVKRDGSKQEFNYDKIINAIGKAFKECDLEEFPKKYIKNRVKKYLLELNSECSVEDIQDAVENCLMKEFPNEVARAYVRYRYLRELARKGNTTDKDLIELIAGTNEYWNKENANKRAERTSTQRDYVAGITSTDFARRKLYSKDVIDAHDEGIIHQHDMDYAIHAGITNCCLVNLADMLDNGTIVNDILIESPKRFVTACTIATQILAGVSGSQYGGMTVTISHLAPYLRKSKEYWFKTISNKAEAYHCYLKELKDGVQTFNYQLNSINGTNGQSPFATVHIDLEENPEYEDEIQQIAIEFLNQRILGFKNKLGIYVTQTFPKIIVVLRDKYFTNEEYKGFIYLCAKCTALRMVPDYMSEKNMLKYKGAIVPAMSCRSLLTPIYPNGELKLWGRFNLGVSTINLPYIAYMSNSEKEFWTNLDKYTELCRKAQLQRVERISSSTSDCAPLLWQYGAFSRLKPHTKLSEIIYGGYASISLGYAGLYECVTKMVGESHSQPKGFDFAEKVMQFLVDKCNKWKELDNLSWNTYGTPIESTTLKFAKALHKFGYKENFITNSIHLHVTEKIDPFTKLEIEGKLQKYSTGGNVNYVESANMNNNLNAIISVMKAINDYSLYAEINGKNDYCENCGSTEEQQIDENMNWFCSNCGCKDTTKLYHPRRICGYIQVGDSNIGRTSDIKNRFVHLDNHICNTIK